MTRHPAERHLARVDPRLAEAIRRCGAYEMPERTADLEGLCGAIIGQQLSTTAASTIRARFTAAFGTGPRFDAHRILNAPHAELLAPGLSNAKARAVRDACRHWTERRLTPAKLRRMEDDAIIEELTRIKGVGPWTVKMILMFHLGRPDVLPIEDLGLRAGLKSLHALDELPTPACVEQIAEPWRPYRSIGTWYCWRWLHFDAEHRKATRTPPPRKSGKG